MTPPTSFTKLIKLGALLGAQLLASACVSGPESPLGNTFKFHPDEVEPKPFVKAARVDPDKLNYLSIGFQDVGRKTPVKSAAEAGADTRSLAASGEQAKSRLGAPVAKSTGLTEDELKKKRKALIDGQTPAQ